MSDIERLNFEQFKEAAVAAIQEHLPEEYKDYEVQLRDTAKSGLGELTGVVIYKDTASVSPCLYLNEAFQEYQKYDLSLDAVLTDLWKGFNTALTEAPEMYSFFDVPESVLELATWEKAKDKIYLKAVPLTGNEKYLSGLSHIEQGDMAAICQIHLGTTEKEEVFISVTDKIQNYMGIDKDTLFRTAEQNVLHDKKPHILPISEAMLGVMLGETTKRNTTFAEDIEMLPSKEEMEEMESPLLTVMTSDTLNGAATLFSSEIMNQIAGKFDDGFYILPSSIHEFLIVPKNTGIELDVLNNMVKEVNANEVRPEDRLSDFVHEYDPKAKQLYVAGTTPPSLTEEKKATQDKKQAPKSH